MASFSGSKRVINLNHRLQSVGAMFWELQMAPYRLRFGSCSHIRINEYKSVSSSQFRKFKLNIFNELIMCPAQLVQ